ncbi:hypothetical protein MTR67_013918 [Solanum verrucosum]|uniref:Tripeptidyl peptidase II Ig-like domain-containing protein n=1 Tax=Solanum verrucosum TaxID=315347 RepID=A0AAF0QCC5_SOLVR|nr:hypothetical protein MTR67_013918 [Solanum verrucosum]
MLLIALAANHGKSGQIERRFIEVPFGATWVEATMRTYGFDTARRFFIDTVQLSPLQRPIKWESVATFSSPSSKNFAFRVEGGQTMELAIAQFWSSGIGSHETTIVDFEIAFRGINISKEEVVLDGSEAPVRIDAEALLSTEKLVPSAVLNKIRVPYRPIDCKLHALSADRDKLPSGKQILALTLTYKFKLEDDAELKPQIPLLNNRIYDNKFESQFYMISDVNKRVHAKGDVYPDSSKLPKGEYTVQLYLRHDNVQYLEKMKQLVLFIERKLEEKLCSCYPSLHVQDYMFKVMRFDLLLKVLVFARSSQDIVRLNFYSQPDGPLTGDGSFNSSDLVPGVKEAFYVGPPAKDKLPKNSREGSVLFGPISYEGGKSLQKNPASYQISYIVPPIKLDEDKGKSSSDAKSVSERLEEEVRDAKIKILASLNQGTDEERAEWKKLSQSLKSEYPKYTPLLAKILEGVLSRSNIEDKFHHFTESLRRHRSPAKVCQFQMPTKIISASDEVVASIDRDELARYCALRSDPEDEATEKLKKKMETTRDQLTEALYQKGLALAELEALKGESTADKVDMFEENFKELKKWVDLKSSKYGILSVFRERHHGRLGTALKVLNDMIQDDGSPPKKKFYELKLSLLDQIGWSHLVVYEKQWMQVRFPSSLPLF